MKPECCNGRKVVRTMEVRGKGGKRIPVGYRCLDCEAYFNDKGQKLVVMTDEKDV